MPWNENSVPQLGSSQDLQAAGLPHQIVLLGPPVQRLSLLIHPAPPMPPYVGGCAISVPLASVCRAMSNGLSWGHAPDPEDRPIYRLLTGKDDRAFCERVSEALEQGWRLYGSPALAWDEAGGCMKAAQAVVWHGADVVKD